MNNEIAIIEIEEFQPVVKQSGLEKAELYAATFAPFMITIKELSNKAATINKENPSALDAKLAREVRLAMVKNRTATGKQKDLSKATILAEGNLIQNLHNVVVNISTLVEADMEAVEKFAENKEKERLAALQAERAELLLPYAENANELPLSSMDDAQFTTMLSGYKLAHEQKIAEAARVEAERLAKEQADKLEQERIRLENERLKQEVDAAAKALELERAETARLAKIEQDKADAIAKENADKLAAIEAANKAASDKAAAELKAAQDAAAKAAAELQERKNAEDKAASEKLAAEKKAAKAPVKQKLAAAIDNLTLNLPESDITNELLEKFEGFKAWAINKITLL